MKTPPKLDLEYIKSVYEGKTKPTEPQQLELDLERLDSDYDGE